MAVFAYRATDMDGLVSEGFIEAADKNAAAERLKHSGSIPLRIEARGGSSARRFGFGTHQAVLTFTSQLSDLIGAGLSLDGSLQILSGITENKEMSAAIQSITRSIREGTTFSDALQKYPGLFSKTYVNMIRAGEAGGVLDVVLERLLELLESARDIKGHIFSAMIYPVILTATGGLSLILLLAFVMPRFAVIFSELGGAVPAPTKLFLAAGDILSSYGWFGLAAAAAGWVAFRRYIRSASGRRRWDALKIRLLGDLIVKIETARFCRTLGTLLKSGVPLVQGLLIAKDIVSNQVIAGTLAEIATGLRQGRGLSVPLAEAKVFPPLAVSMIKVGEETGRLDQMLIKVALAYEKSLKEAVRRFISLLEPALILTMGLIIGAVIVSMLMAVFAMMDLPF